MPQIAAQTWWLTEDLKARVPDGDPRAFSLLIHEGSAVSEEIADALRNIPEAPRPNEKGILEPPQNKAITMEDAKKRDQKR